MMTDRPAVDALQQMLDSFHFDASFFANPTLCSRWQLSFPAQPQMTFHLVGGGQCWLHLPGGDAPIPLREGDFLMVTHPLAHILSSAQTRALADYQSPPDDGPATTLICGSVKFAGRRSNPLLDALPDYFILRPLRLDEDIPLQTLLLLLSHETQQQNFASQVVLDKLAAALFVMVLRRYLEQQTQPLGLLRALSDPRLQPVLSAMHQELKRNWQLDELAALACMSRSAFAQYFKECVGLSPGAYLQDWRMAKAELLLGDPTNPVPRVADLLGYSTEAAFRRAFKRHYGVGPGELRRRARELSLA